MKTNLSLLVPLLWTLQSVHCPGQSAESVYLIRDGVARAAIVAPAQPSAPVQMAIDELRYHVQRVCGVSLAVVPEDEAAGLPAVWVRVAIGSEQFAKQVGIDPNALPVDGFRVKVQGSTIVFAGHDSRAPGSAHNGGWNAATVWAVDHFLDTQLGVRWLWPGAVGTYLPRRRDILLPQIDFTGRPALELRQFAALLFRSALRDVHDHNGTCGHHEPNPCRHWTGCRRVPMEDPALKDHPRVFALQVQNDAMCGCHIVAGDVLIFEHGLEPRSGDVIAAFVDGQSEVRSYVIQGGRPFLKAAHPDQTDLTPAQELLIQGTLVRSIRDCR